MPEPHDDPQDRQAAASGSSPQQRPPGLDSPHEALPPGVPLARPVHADLPSVLSACPPAPPAPPPHPILLADSPRRASYLIDVGAATAAFLAMEAVFTPLAASAVGFDRDMLRDSTGEITQALLVPLMQLRVMYVLIIVAVVLRFRRESWASVGMTSRRVGMDVLIGLGCPFVAYAVIMPIMLLLVMALPKAYEQMNQNARNLQTLLPDIPLWHYLPFMAIVGVWEELFFRGFVMTRLRRVTGSWTAGVVLSTLVFAALHLFEQTLTALVPITILSILFSVVTIWRRSLLPAIVGHALFNFSQVMWMSIAARYLSPGGS